MGVRTPMGAGPHGGLWGPPWGAVWGSTAPIAPDGPWGRLGLKKDTESVPVCELRKWTSPKIPVYLMVRHHCIVGSPMLKLFSQHESPQLASSRTAVALLLRAYSSKFSGIW